MIAPGFLIKFSFFPKVFKKSSDTNSEIKIKMKIIDQNPWKEES